MASDGYNHLFIAKVKRVKVADETAEVRLILLKDRDTVHLTEGDELITIKTKVDPFEEQNDAR